MPFEIAEVNIASDLFLLRQFRYRVPVIETPARLFYPDAPRTEVGSVQQHDGAPTWADKPTAPLPMQPIDLQEVLHDISARFAQ